MAIAIKKAESYWGSFYSQWVVFDDNQSEANSASLIAVLDDINQSGKGTG